MIDAATLLADLQAELKGLVADLTARVATEGEVREPLETEWRHAFDENRTGRTFEAWLEDRLTQVGVGWLLACVFVRFCEDNHLIDEARIAGPGEQGAAARAAQQSYFAAHPHDSDREYLQSVFRLAASLPGLSGVLGESDSPLWLVDPPADACTRLLALLRRTSESGVLVHDCTDAELSTRFLGDLYQDLSEFAKDTYALLQTPEFVEEFILDRTLTPAIETFGLARTTLIDPTCGSGHFLLGAFERLWRAWRTAEPAAPERDLAQRALAGVTGVDLNPFAAAIAHFRLLVAALKVCAIRDLRSAPHFTIEVVVGDSLLWGARSGQFPGMEAAATSAERQFLYRTEHAEALRRVFSRQYTAVVGNPPYIVCRDPALNQQYRDRYKSCHRQYSLCVPFMEKFFELAVTPDNLGRPAGYIGMITANSFMKREFGKKLIEQFIPTWDLTHVIDTSGSYIPGHGTPTVILLGRHQRPVQSIIRTVMGIRGEPATPPDPANGLVWSAIVAQIDEPGSESVYVSVSNIERTRFSTHPWTIGGGGAAELKERLDESSAHRLREVIDPPIGRAVRIGADELFEVADVQHRHSKAPASDFSRYLVGEFVRDWSARPDRDVWYPYGTCSGQFLIERWAWRSVLRERRTFQGVMADAGLDWWLYMQHTPSAYVTPLSIAFSNMATHNHFVLTRGGMIFNAHAPIIKLLEETTVDDHLALVAFLNSSVACFWMQQVFFNKGAGGGARVDAGFSPRGSEEWENHFEFDGTKLQQFPLPEGKPPLDVARKLDTLATDLAAGQPSVICDTATPTRTLLDAARVESERILAEMVAAQEELDWRCLHLYKVTEKPFTAPLGETLPPLALGERAFEIVLARQGVAGEIETAWFTRHRSMPITDLPAHWPDWYRELVQRRIDLIERDRNVALVERPEHKRRWARESWEKLEEAALSEWLTDRLEDRRLWSEGSGDAERAVCRSVAQLADKVSALDPDFLPVARLWKGVVEIDAVAVIAELVTGEHVPAQSAARYKPSGLTKRRQWERTWDLQRIEDCGEPLPGRLDRIPVPPKFAPTDFLKSSYWSQRGKLDVPNERFVSIAAAERDADSTLVLAWAGFDHAQQAQAIGTLLVERQQHDGWDSDRLWPLVVALSELLPWLDEWHAEVDPRWGASPARLYRDIAEQYAMAGGRTLADTAQWQPAAPTRGRRRAGVTQLQMTNEDDQ